MSATEGEKRSFSLGVLAGVFLLWIAQMAFALASRLLS